MIQNKYFWYNYILYLRYLKQSALIAGIKTSSSQSNKFTLPIKRINQQNWFTLILFATRLTLCENTLPLKSSQSHLNFQRPKSCGTPAVRAETKQRRSIRTQQSQSEKLAGGLFIWHGIIHDQLHFGEKMKSEPWQRRTHREVLQIELTHAELPFTWTRPTDFPVDRSLRRFNSLMTTEWWPAGWCFIDWNYVCAARRALRHDGKFACANNYLTAEPPDVHTHTLYTWSQIFQ